MSDGALSSLVDTDWVIDDLLGYEQAEDLLSNLRPAGFGISIITFVEVMEGVIGGRDRQEAERVFRAFLHGTPVLGIDRAVARRTAVIRVDLRRQNRPITNRAMDLLIAATALEHGLTMVSRNVRDYGDIPGLRLRGTT